MWSTIAQNQVYVTPDNGHSCPLGSTCHNLSYYISQPHIYFTSNTTIIFMSGEHQLNRQEPVMVVGADNLTLEGRGDWIESPEENVMLSTAIIRCTSGNGGFAFTRVCLNHHPCRLTFLTCGAEIYQQHNTTVCSYICRKCLFNLHSIEIQCKETKLDSSSWLLIVAQCKSQTVHSFTPIIVNIYNPSLAARNCTHGEHWCCHV